MECRRSRTVEFWAHWEGQEKEGTFRNVKEVRKIYHQRSVTSPRPSTPWSSAHRTLDHHGQVHRACTHSLSHFQLHATTSPSLSHLPCRPALHLQPSGPGVRCQQARAAHRDPTPAHLTGVFLCVSLGVTNIMLVTKRDGIAGEAPHFSLEAFGQ